jgi:phage gpG-like protein
MSLISIDFKMPDLAAKLERRREEIMLFIAANMQTNRHMLFTSGGSRNGHQTWPKLKIRRGGQPLLNRGVLVKSIGNISGNGKPGPNGIVDITSNTITIGTKLAYAAMMNFGTTGLPGGVLRPVKAKALKFPKNRMGTKFIFAKEVRIPPRRFDQWTEEDQQELEMALRVKLRQVLTNG